MLGRLDWLVCTGWLVWGTSCTMVEEPASVQSADMSEPCGDCHTESSNGDAASFLLARSGERAALGLGDIVRVATDTLDAPFAKSALVRFRGDDPTSIASARTILSQLPASDGLCYPYDLVIMADGEIRMVLAFDDLPRPPFRAYLQRAGFEKTLRMPQALRGVKHVDVAEGGAVLNWGRMRVCYRTNAKLSVRFDEWDFDASVILRNRDRGMSDPAIETLVTAWKTKYADPDGLFPSGTESYPTIYQSAVCTLGLRVERGSLRTHYASDD